MKKFYIIKESIVMKQKMMILAGLLVMAFLMSCGKGGESKDGAAAGGKKDEALVVYSNS